MKMSAEFKSEQPSARFLFFVMMLICFVMLQFSQSAFAQEDISGYWVVHHIYTDGSVHDGYLLLDARKEDISGLQLSRDYGTPLIGTFKDGKLHLVATPINPAQASRQTIYDGSYQDGKFSLQITTPNKDTYQATAEKTTREASLPPAPLPLPALRDLPDNGLVRTPPMGWNSWNKFAGKVTDADVRTMADAMVSSGMSKLGYTYINIDDTWELDRDKNGNITSNNKFPDMKALADYVHSKGLKIGIYSSPGPTTCAGYEASFGHELQDAKTFSAWGFDYLKYDLCSARNIYGKNNINDLSAEDIQAMYQKMGEALQQSGRPIVFSLCEYGDADVWKWGTKVGGNLWRTTGDINDHWASMDKIGFSQLAIASYTRPGHWNDPDMLEIGNGGMSADEYRTHMSLWSMLSAPLLAGNDLRTMTDETKSILMNAEVIAIDQDPAAKPTQILSQQGKVEVLWRPLADGSIVVGIYNRGEEPTEAGFAWDSLNLGPTKNLHARDLWKHTDVAVTGDKFSATVPVHGVALVRVSSTKKKANM